MPITIADLKYAEPSNTLIDMVVTFEPPMSPDELEPIPFTYHPEDYEPVSLAVRALLKEGDFTIAPYVPPTSVPVASKSGTGVDVIA